MAKAEPTDDDELLAAVDANLVAFGRYMAAPVPEPASLFPIEGHGYGIWTRAHADSALEATLPGAGFVLVVDMPVMVLTGTPAPARTLPADHEVRRVVDPTGVADFRLASVAAGAVPGSRRDDEAAVATGAVFGSPTYLLGPEVAAFVAYASREPVAAALSFTDGDLSRIAWVGTVPTHRGRGLGTAVTRAAVCAGLELGSRFSVLESSALGESVYRAMGFRPLTRYRIWLTR